MGYIHLARQQLIQHSNQHSLVYTEAITIYSHTAGLTGRNSMAVLSPRSLDMEQDKAGLEPPNSE